MGILLENVFYILLLLDYIVALCLRAVERDTLLRFLFGMHPY